MATDIAMTMASNLAVNLLPNIIVTVLELVSFAFDTRLPLGPNYRPGLLSLYVLL